MEDSKTKEKIEIVPGELRHRDVAVGRHIRISAPAVPRFLKRYEEVYSTLGKTENIIATAAAHHRLAWIHPFLDGSGRVARLVSRATLLDALDTGAVWSLTRESLAGFTKFFLTICLDQVNGEALSAITARISFSGRSAPRIELGKPRGRHRATHRQRRCW